MMFVFYTFASLSHWLIAGGATSIMTMFLKGQQKGKINLPAMRLVIYGHVRSKLETKD